MWPKLNSLERVLAIDGKSFETPPFVHFDVGTWEKAPDQILRSVAKMDLGPLLVVRSCACSEDQELLEPPGFFKSVLGVPSGNEQRLKQAIAAVIQSYSRRLNSLGDRDAHKVIVQQQLLDPALSGVCRIGDDIGGYIQIDFSEDSGRTDAVTAGLQTNRVTLSPCLSKLPTLWRSVATAARQIGAAFGSAVFIEFAVARSGHVAIFQVRPDRRMRGQKESHPPANVCRLLDKAASILSSTGPLSVMADWNPAEMLGLDPKPLGISLYNKLLLDGAWAEGRASVGWTKPQDADLMAVVAGRPYIKLSASIESLLPSTLAPDLAKRLVLDRLSFLSANRHLHDKIEFRVMWAAATPKTNDALAEMLYRGFSTMDIEHLRESLRSLTRTSFANIDTWLSEDITGMVPLDAQSLHLQHQQWETLTPSHAADKLGAAIGVCRLHGTVPFSRQARLAFMLRYVLNSVADGEGSLAKQIDDWYLGLNTVTRHLSDDLARLAAGQLARRDFDARYGHLRPGAYDIESPRYDEVADFPLSVSNSNEHSPDRPRTTPLPHHAVASFLSELGLDFDEDRFWRSCGDVFRAREEIKFRFTALLSNLLLSLSKIGAMIGLSREDLGYFGFDELLSALARSKRWADVANRLLVSERRSMLKREALLVLPDVCFDPVDFFIVRAIESRPTFVCSTIVTAPLTVISASLEAASVDLNGRIVVIRCPDPGYDWVFAHSIAGLITEYGGEFSHMSLRCAEFGIPAAIGCGPRVLDGLLSASSATIDGRANEVWVDGRRLCKA